VAEQKPTKKDFVDLINTVMGQEVMTEEQLSKFLHDAKQIHTSKGTEGLLQYIQKVTNAPTNQSQLKKLADQIQQTGNPGAALDFLKGEKLLTDQHVRKINHAIEKTKRKKRKR